MDAERLCRALLNNGLPEQPRQHPGASPSRTPFAPDSSETPWPELPDPFPGELEGDPLSLSINSSPVGCLAVALDEENF